MVDAYQFRTVLKEGEKHQELKVIDDTHVLWPYICTAVIGAGGSSLTGKACDDETDGAVSERANKRAAEEQTSDQRANKLSHTAVSQPAQKIELMEYGREEQLYTSPALLLGEAQPEALLPETISSRVCRARTTKPIIGDWPRESKGSSATNQYVRLAPGARYADGNDSDDSSCSWPEFKGRDSEGDRAIENQPEVHPEVHGEFESLGRDGAFDQDGYICNINPIMRRNLEVNVGNLNIEKGDSEWGWAHSLVHGMHARISESDDISISKRVTDRWDFPFLEEVHMPSSQENSENMKELIYMCNWMGMDNCAETVTYEEAITKVKNFRGIQKEAYVKNYTQGHAGSMSDLKYFQYHLSGDKPNVYYGMTAPFQAVIESLKTQNEPLIDVNHKLYLHECPEGEVLDKDMKADSCFNGETLRERAERNSLADWDNQGYREWASKHCKESGKEIKGLRNYRSSFGGLVWQAMRMCSYNVCIMFLDKVFPMSLTRNMYTNGREGPIRTLFVLCAKSLEGTTDGRGMPGYEPGIIVVHGASIYSELRALGHNLKFSVTHDGNGVGGTCCLHCGMTLQHILKTRTMGIPEQASEENALKRFAAGRCKNAHVRTDVASMEVRDLQARSIHTHLIISNKGEEAPYQLMGQGASALLVPVPRQRNVGETLLACMVTMTLGGLPDWIFFGSEKRKFLHKVMAKYQAELHLVMTDKSPWITALDIARPQGIDQEALEDVLFGRDDNSRVQAYRGRDGITRFDEVVYPWDLMRSILQECYQVNIVFIDAGTAYTLGWKGLKDYMRMEASRHEHTDMRYTVFLYRHRDVICPVMEGRSEGVTYIERQREYLEGNLPAGKIPAKAFNAVSILVPADDEEMMKKFEKCLNGIELGSCEGADGMYPSYTSHGFGSHHGYEMYLDFMKRAPCQTTAYRLEIYGADEHMPDDLMRVQELGSIMSSLSLNELKLQELFDEYLPVSHDRFVHPGNSERRHVVLGKIRTGINAGMDARTHKCFNSRMVAKGLRGSEDEYAEARRKIWRFETDTARFFLTIWAHKKNTELRILTSKTPAFADRHEAEPDRYREYRCFTAQDAAVYPHYNMASSQGARAAAQWRDTNKSHRLGRHLVMVPHAGYFGTWRKGNRNIPHRMQRSDGDIYMNLRCEEDEDVIGHPGDYFTSIKYHKLGQIMLDMYGDGSTERMYPRPGTTTISAPKFCIQDRPEVQTVSCGILEAKCVNATREHMYDYGTSGSDCVHRMFRAGLNCKVETNTITCIHALADLLRTLTTGPALPYLKEHIRNTRAALALHLGREVFKNNTEFITAWRNYLLNHGGKLDLLGMMLLAYKHAKSIVCRTRTSNFILYNLDEQEKYEIVVLTNDDKVSHVLHQVPALEKTSMVCRLGPTKEDILEFLKRPIGGLSEGAEPSPSAITTATNEYRLSRNQEPMCATPSAADFDDQAHDPGEFGRTNVIRMHTNLMRNLHNQESLEPSQSRSDVDMHNVDFHEQEEALLRMDVNMSTLESRLERYFHVPMRDPDEDVPVKSEDLPRAKRVEKVVAYLARMMTKDKEGNLTFLWDSGATKSVIGCQELIRRLLAGKECLYNHPERGTLDQEDMELDAVDTSSKPIQVIVANGQRVQGQQIKQLDIGVEGTCMATLDGEEESFINSIFLRLMDPVVCEDIQMNVISEAYFMMTNPGWTLITRGNKKLLCYGKPDIRFKPLNGQKAIKIALRYEDGAHYLDVNDAVRNRANIKMKRRKRTGLSFASVSHPEKKEVNIKCNAITTQKASADAQTHTESKDYEACYVETMRASCVHVPADGTQPYKYMIDANKGNRDNENHANEQQHARVNQAFVVSREQTPQDSLLKLHKLFESADSSQGEREAAIEEMKVKTEELKAWLTFYQKTNTAAVNGIQAAKRRKGKSAPESQESAKADDEWEDSQPVIPESLMAESAENTGLRRSSRHQKAHEQTAKGAVSGQGPAPSTESSSVATWRRVKGKQGGDPESAKTTRPEQERQAAMQNSRRVRFEQDLKQRSHGAEEKSAERGKNVRGAHTQRVKNVEQPEDAEDPEPEEGTSHQGEPYDPDGDIAPGKPETQSQGEVNDGTHSDDSEDQEIVQFRKERKQKGTEKNDEHSDPPQKPVRKYTADSYRKQVLGKEADANKQAHAADVEEPMYGLYDTENYVKKTRKNIRVYQENVYIHDIEIDEAHDFTLATFLMNNRIGLWLPDYTFPDSEGIAWKVTPFKVKKVTRDGQKRVAVEALFIDYMENTREMTPDLKNWNKSICTLMASWEGAASEVTLRNLIKSNFEGAKTLSDLVAISKEELRDGKRLHDVNTQTTERIYTFPMPIPAPIDMKSVTMGEPELKAAVKAKGELWHARLGHVNEETLQFTREAYPEYGIPRKFLTDSTVQAGKCECCEKCKATIKRKIKCS